MNVILTSKHSKADIKSDEVIKLNLSIGGISGGHSHNRLGAETVTKAGETLMEFLTVNSSRVIPVHTRKGRLGGSGFKQY